MGKPSQVIVLAEDARHQQFIRHYLKRLGLSLHEMRFEELPSGRGSGEQWVRERYAGAVMAYRARVVRAQTTLVVAIDANGDANRRIRQLQRALEEGGAAPRSDHDRIVHLIPNRNIESWIRCLAGANADEDTDYSKEPDIEQHIKPAASTFFDWSRPSGAVPESCLPSLRSALVEIRKLDQ
jgi:hypothetical protein